MSVQELTSEEEALLAPVSFEVMTTVHGMRVANRCFIRQKTWDALEGEAAQVEKIETTLHEIAKAILMAIKDNRLLAPEKSEAV